MVLYTHGMKQVRLDAVMKRVRAQFEASGLSLDELGRKMGHKVNPRQSAWQFLNKTADPRLSMLLRFAEAISADPKDIL
jgi:hypothetical protein